MRSKKHWIILAAALMLVLAIGGVKLFDLARGPKVTILMYHHLVADGEAINGMTITESRFRQDMEWLRDHGYTTVLPRELAAGAPVPNKAVMVTFDDGYSSNYHIAFPILRELEMKAAIAVIGRVVDADGTAFLTWDMCREMSDSGLVEIGSHSYDLHNMDQREGCFDPDGPNGIQRLDGESRQDFEARVLADLQQSIDAVQQGTGVPATYFAYPFGVTEPWADQFIREHFSLTLLTNEGTARTADGLYSLPRKTISMERPVSACFGLVGLWKQFRASM